MSFVDVFVVIKCMRWKAFYFDRHEQDNNDAANNDHFGFKSRKCPPQNNDLDKFAADLLAMVHNITFRNVNKKYQNKLNEFLNLKLNEFLNLVIKHFLS